MYRFLVLVVILFSYSNASYAAGIAISLAEPPSTGVLDVTLYEADGVNDYQNIVRTERYPLNQSNNYHMDNVEPGNYAMRLYVDLNQNNKLDTNFIGIPTEPIGFSNNYQPKTRPAFKPAVFTLKENTTAEINVSLQQPLGNSGLVSVGLATITRNNAYRGTDTATTVVPAVTYIGDRLQVLGPEVRLSLAGSESFGTGAVLSYRFPAYSEKDSDFLNGLGDRESALLLGLSIQKELSEQIALKFRYQHDVLDKIGGGLAKLGLENSYQSGNVNWSSGIALQWLDRKLSNHEFGVPADASNAVRMQYSPDNVTSLETSLGANVSFASDWRLILSFTVEFLGDAATDSPIVDENRNISLLAAISYTL